MRRSVLLVCLLMVSAFGARAEQLVLPFSCHLSKDGGTKAIPPIRTYDVLGSRTSKVIRLCPASAGSQCRQAVVHKFDIDCDGRRVAWRAVADQMLKQRNLTLARGANADEKFLQIGEGGLAALNVLCDDVASGDSNDPELRRICLEAASVPASSLRLPAGFALVAEFGGRIERSALSTQTALRPDFIGQRIRETFPQANDCNGAAGRSSRCQHQAISWHCRGGCIRACDRQTRTAADARSCRLGWKDHD